MAKRWISYSILHPMNAVFHSALLVFLLLLPWYMHGQKQIPWNESSEKAFRYALQVFERGDYLQAGGRFEEIAFKSELHHRSSAAIVMACRAWFRSGNTERCRAMVDSLLHRFPDSRYVPEALRIAARSYQEEGNDKEALYSLTLAALRCREDCRDIETSLHGILVDIPAEHRKSVAERLFRQGIAFDELRRLAIVPSKAEASSSNRTQWHRPTLLALLPTGDHRPRVKTIAEEIQRGIMLALQRFNASYTMDAQVHVVDNANLVTLDSIFYTLQNIDALLVGAMSEDARHCITALRSHDVPILLPTANDADLTQLSPAVFQLNAPLQLRAMLLADFVHFSLDTDEIMLLRCRDPLLRRMSDEFVRRMRQHGRRVQLRSRHSSVELAQAIQAFNSMHGGKSRLLVAPALSSDDIEAVLHAVSGVDGDYQLLGMGNWYQENTLRRFSHVTVIFDSDEPVQERKDDGKHYTDSGEQTDSYMLSRHAMFGYDACSIALGIAARVRGDRSAFIAALQDVFEGIRAPVNFMTGRSNASLALYKYERGVFEKLESIYAK
jgi:hypothetical protein